MIQIDIVHHELSDLAKDAPALCCQHLLDLQQAADDQGDPPTLASYWKSSPRSKNKKNGVVLTQQHAHHEAEISS
jgi:hypothetical protein